MILETQNLTKEYKHKQGVIKAIDNISLKIEKGSFVTITGPSGSGKSTLLLTLGGLIRPSSGKIIFNDKELNTGNDAELADFRGRHVGFVMQNFALIPYLTAIQNIMIPLYLKKGEGVNKKEYAKSLLTKVGLEDRMNHLPRELSAGQQQRVAIARALANKPPLIMADEPTGNLDPALSFEILELLREINKQEQITIIMVTHSPAAAGFGDHKIVLKDGLLKAEEKKGKISW